MSMLLLVLLTLAITLLSVMVLSLISYANKRVPRLPPGSIGWPIVGEFLSFARTHPTYTLGYFMKDHINRYGKIFTMNIFGNLTIVSADAELNHLIINNDKLFGQGWPDNLADIGGETATTLATGDAHKRQRSYILNFFSGSKLEERILEVEDLVSALVDSWKDNTVISAKKELTHLTFNIAIKKIMNMEPGSSETMKMMKEFDIFIPGVFAFPLKFPGTVYWKAFKAKSNIAKVVKCEMEKRKQNNGNAKQDDLLSFLMDENLYSLEQIINLMLDFVSATYMSTSTAIPVLLFFIASCPKALRQLREEHLEMIEEKKQRGEDKLTWEDCKKLQFTHCVINEALRLGNFQVLPKKAKSEIKFKGFVIPRECVVLTHLSAMHLDPTMYENPEQFNPWRWMGPSGIKNVKYFMPFGGGIRLCPGSELARLEMIVFLHHFMMKFNWSLVKPDCPISLPHIGFVNGLQLQLNAWSRSSETAN